MYIANPTTAASNNNAEAKTLVPREMPGCSDNRLIFRINTAPIMRDKIGQLRKVTSVH